MKKKIIKALYKSKCAETGKNIKKGEGMLYDYLTKLCYCIDSKTYQDFENENVDNESSVSSGMDGAEQEARFDNFCYLNNI